VETRFFPSEAHVFTPAAMQSVRGDAARFFDRWLSRRSRNQVDVLVIPAGVKHRFENQRQHRGGDV
jgi:hypothetical protein